MVSGFMTGQEILQYMAKTDGFDAIDEWECYLDQREADEKYGGINGKKE
jgi:hypothetical protein